MAGHGRTKTRPNGSQDLPWYNNSRGATLPEHTSLPYEIEVGLHEDDTPLLPFHAHATSESRILITKTYEDIFHRLLDLRRVDKSSRGAVITGQPGTGKSTFLKYMLIRLFSASQVVLLCNTTIIHLFFNGHVYSRPTSSGFHYLPRRPGFDNPPWASVDVDFQECGAPVDNDSNVWPIQVSDPNPIRWKSWLKRFGGVEWGMPLWNLEDLLRGLRLQVPYAEFRNSLATALSAESAHWPVPQDAAIVDALEVLRREKALNLDDMRDEEDTDIFVEPTKKDEVDDALEVLVRNATEEVGFAPRDVYGLIFASRRMKNDRIRAFNTFDYSGLESLSKTFQNTRALSYEQSLVVAVSPYQRSLGEDDGWRMDFKSIRIAKEAVFKLMEKDDQQLLGMYRSLCQDGDSESLA